MRIAVNLTAQAAVAELVTRDGQGAPLYVVIVKQSYGFAAPGPLAPMAAAPIAPLDQYAGDPGASSLLVAGEVGPPKPRVDVILTGTIRFPSPTTDAVVALEVGNRLSKRLRIVGDRVWLPRASSDLGPSRPRPITEIPIAWERAAGGADPAGDPQLTDRRNPAGCAVGRTARDFEGKPLPSFEDPGQPTTSWRSPLPPRGFGAVAPHWEPRARLAGTYDQRWQEQRAPLLPEDFDPRFLNAAPDDQQLPDYQPGEEVRLLGLTRAGPGRFALPELSVPIMFVTRDLIDERRARVDTIVVELDQARVSLIARAVCAPGRSVAALRQIFVGPLTPGRRRALELGKPYLDLRPRPAAPDAAKPPPPARARSKG